MSLIKMLSFAKSLRGEGDERRPYELIPDNLLPDFSRSSPRPVLNREEPLGNGAGCARISEMGGQGGLGTLGFRSTEEKGETMREQQDEKVVGAKAAGTVAGASTPSASAPRERSRWLSGRSGARPTLRADAKGQLSLEFVRVVRNDLSDADLELVPARPVGTIAPKSREVGPTPHSVEPLEPEPSRWSRFTARLFGTGTST